ncbi:zinc finger BED domain-containing protein 4-like [Ditylenchus destructor]|uniref:Zinc finger BED domain-containing protein 4-like n=1 Tax=Ditylenchus destructor TaxID=166010 RepID=A0AAD4MLF0_9BILA|nr:zinc finger BED domain-containing protein 4-like [Ditylenchus destructor]
MSLYGKYFTRSGRIAICKIGPCKYEKDLGVNSDTNFLKSHMRAVHKEQYKEFLDLKTKQAEKAPPSQKGAIIRMFQQSIEKSGDESHQTDVASSSTTPEPAIKKMLHARRVKSELAKSNYISFTSDAWTSKNGAHSLLSLTAHFVDPEEPQTLKRFVLAAVPIKGKHNADNFVTLINTVVGKFEIPREKIYMLTRDAAATMIKAARDLGLKSIDCFAHKLNLAVQDGLSLLNNDLDSILERVKRFIRKLPQTLLQKDTQVRWNSTYTMVERFVSNVAVVNLMCRNHSNLPQFSNDDWTTQKFLQKDFMEIDGVGEDNRDSILATLLDPRYKSRY